ncbi:MAG: hypothetical protein CFH41_00252 [Alphaproteobacteria bacterium MarineAlpha11_Bin1]|nr:MAG: hypothetical protein CFH41_00252 [Alphaproteobacteria bacterium MarineAlpha11_Bin1]|tara:strand:+ start:19060 stop:19842 length:783 start_codon:yes stop_codon:yes gene_type:complete
MAADLYVGEVMHRRSRPKAYTFVYRVFNILVDIDTLEKDARARRLFSYNRFNLFSFFDRDHGARDGSTLRPWVENHLAAAGLSHASANIRLLCMPRVLGYGFDPLSIYYCSDDAGQLAAILYEVKNTFGDQHGYLFGVDNSIKVPQKHVANKVLHVSPLISMNARYQLRTQLPDDKLAVLIQESDEAGEFLVASLTGERRDMTDGAMLSWFFKIPLLTFKIILAIHFEAIRLMLRGVKYTKRPEPPAQDVSLPPSRRDIV